MANVKNNSASQDTRRRLLCAAGEVFAQRGFHAATIKDITDAAGASLASVNYHFQDKQELYAAVLRRIADEVAEAVPPDTTLTGDAKARFRQFIEYFCGRLMGREKPAWEQILMAREMAEPTAALEPLYEHVIGPLSQKLSAVIADLLGVSATDKVVGLAAASVLGQCVYYMRHRNLFPRMHPQLGERPDIEQLTSHIIQFSLAGIERFVLFRQAGLVNGKSADEPGEDRSIALTIVAFNRRIPHSSPERSEGNRVESY